ncbi:type VII secretion protein EccB [Amycolatopsis sp. NPDC059027]|uniref:type VII secretion protein EccB n=1 Tax=unclassified Amycolatopsis TaxID=2618356 RepID=UPI003671FE65
MQSRRDQVQAYFYVVGRLVAAVVHGKPDVLQPPNKRLNTGVFLGIVVGAIVMGIFGIYGVFVPGGNTSWRQPGAIVMNETTGARYIYLEDQLRPVLNYSSARLAAGKSGSGQVVSVAQKSLSGTPVGQPIGIVGAPDALPTALDDGPWTVCAQPPAPGPQGQGPTISLVLGHPLQQTLNDKQALLARTPDGTNFLIWRGKRHRIPSRTEAEALGYNEIAPVQATAAWVNAVPAGQDVSAAVPADVGSPGPSIDGHASVVGQIYQVRNPAIGTTQLYLIRSDGVAALSRTNAALLMASPSIRAAYQGSAVEPIPAGPGALSGAPASTSGPDLVGALPPEPPQIVSPPPDAMACANFSPLGTGERQVTAGLLSTSVSATKGMPVGAHAAGMTADRVVIPAGSGVLAAEQPAPGAPPGAVYLITETGTKYPLANGDVAGALGYSAQSAVRIPAELLSLLPSGPLLSMEGALRVQS